MKFVRHVTIDDAEKVRVCESARGGRLFDLKVMLLVSILAGKIGIVEADNTAPFLDI